MFTCTSFSIVMRKVFTTFLTVVLMGTMLVPPGTAVAQGALGQGYSLPAPDRFLPSSTAYVPAVIKGLSFDAKDPLRFRFIVDTGDSNLEGVALQEEARKLVKYFMAGLTTPDKDFWVNLSPYEKERIIPESFGNTEMGRDLLGQDYVLKQLMSSLMSPEQALGKEFWARVHAKAKDLYGSTEIPLNTFSKVWIVPENATLLEKDGQVLVGSTYLKVLLAEDYSALQKTLGDANVQPVSDIMHGATAEVVRAVLIPELEREINEGQNFAPLRQIFHSMVLAIWVKRNFRTGLLGQVYMDQNKTPGIEVIDKTDKNQIFDRYVEAFQKGVYSHIKEEWDIETGEMIPRRYFSGGFGVTEGHDWAQVVEVLPASSESRVLFPAAFAEDGHGKNVLVDVAMVAAGGRSSDPAMASQWAQAVVLGVLVSFIQPALGQAQMGAVSNKSSSVLSMQELSVLEKNVRGLVYNKLHHIKDRPEFIAILAMGPRVFPALLRMIVAKKYSDGTVLSGDQMRWAAYLAVRLAPDQKKAEELEYFLKTTAYPWDVLLEAESGLLHGGREKQRAQLFLQIQESIADKFLKLTPNEVVLLSANVAQLKAPHFSGVKDLPAFKDILSMGSKSYPYLVQMILNNESRTGDSLKWVVYLAARTAPDQTMAERLKDFIAIDGYSLPILLEANTGLQDGVLDKQQAHLFDKAQQASQEKTLEKNLGGISLDPALLEMPIERDGQGVPLPLNQQNLALLRIPGLVPVITSMAILSDVFFLRD